jgi:hypothetical protein
MDLHPTEFVSHLAKTLKAFNKLSYKHTTLLKYIAQSLGYGNHGELARDLINREKYPPTGIAPHLVGAITQEIDLPIRVGISKQDWRQTLLAARVQPFIQEFNTLVDIGNQSAPPSENSPLIGIDSTPKKREATSDTHPYIPFTPAATAIFEQLAGTEISIFPYGPNRSDKCPTMKEIEENIALLVSNDSPVWIKAKNLYVYYQSLTVRYSNGEIDRIQRKEIDTAIEAVGKTLVSELERYIVCWHTLRDVTCAADIKKILTQPGSYAAKVMASLSNVFAEYLGEHTEMSDYLTALEVIHRHPLANIHDAVANQHAFSVTVKKHMKARIQEVERQNGSDQEVVMEMMRTDRKQYKNLDPTLIWALTEELLLREGTGDYPQSVAEISHPAGKIDQ